MSVEDRIISNLQRNFAEHWTECIGIGDDAAVLPISEENYIVSKDLLLENKHFRLSYFDASSLAHKAVHANLSDIAAMGGVPTAILLGIGVPNDLTKLWIEEFLQHITTECHDNSISLIGGDTVGANSLCISITIIGKTNCNRVKLRSGARCGDIVCIVGNLGEAYAGFVALEREVEGFKEVKQKFLRPNAMIAEGRWLGSRSEITSMVDVSDGLYPDLLKISRSSGVMSIIDLHLLEPSSNLSAACSELQLDPLECMIIGGEDYILCFSVSQSDFDLLSSEFYEHFAQPIYRVGIIKHGEGVVLQRNGETQPNPYQPFDHFKTDDYT